MRQLVFLLLISIQPALAGLDKHSDLVVADPPNQPRKSGSIRITYLGTNGYQLEAAGQSLLIDPYFSRISLARAGLGWRIRPDAVRMDEGMSHLTGRVNAILITHAHFDHLLDGPPLMQRTGAPLVGSPTAIELARRAGADDDKCIAVRAGAVRQLGRWRVQVLSASHDRLMIMGVPYDRPLKNAEPPRRASDWVCGEPLSYLVSANGQSIFIDSGGTPEVLPPAKLGRIDLAILGVALPDSRARFTAAMRRLRPRYVLPSHQDNFFVPLSRGFQFAALSDFGFVRRQHDQQHLPGRLILLDYFRPWTLPRR